MAWTDPTTRTTGELVTASDWNTDLTNNLLYLATGGTIGYTTGVGGTQTQGTSKSTTITLNALCGTITMNNAALAANTKVTFQCNNSYASTSSVVLANVQTMSGVGDNYTVEPHPGSGVINFDVTNVSGSSQSDAVLINFSVFQIATA